MNRLAMFLHYLSILAAFLLVVACAQTPGPKLPSLLLQAERHNIKGVAAESDQKFDLSENEFVEAYRLYSSVENYRGMVISLVNSSRLYRRLGDKTKVEKVLKLAVEMVPNTPELESEVCFEMAKLALLNTDHSNAISWAARGVKSASGAERGKMLNLLAAIYFKKADLLKAREVADSALSASRKETDKLEEANALRNLGDIASAENKYKESFKMYEAALPIDKELALPLRISDDLRGIAHSLEQMGEPESAADFYKRSVYLNIAERDYKRAVVDLEKLRVILGKIGKMDKISNIAELVEKLKNSSQAAKQR